MPSATPTATSEQEGAQHPPLGGRVRLAGHLEDLPELLHAAGLFGRAGGCSRHVLMVSTPPQAGGCIPRVGRAHDRARRERNGRASPRDRDARGPPHRPADGGGRRARLRRQRLAAAARTHPGRRCDWARPRSRRGRSSPGEHLQRVIDVGTAPNGDLVAVLDDVPHALADLVAARALDAGEAVTVLVPLAAALAELQAAGVVHGAIGARGRRAHRRRITGAAAAEDGDPSGSGRRGHGRRPARARRARPSAAAGAGARRADRPRSSRTRAAPGSTGCSTSPSRGRSPCRERPRRREPRGRPRG